MLQNAPLVVFKKFDLPMRDCDNSTVRKGPPQDFLYKSIGLQIHVGSCLVDTNDSRRRKDGTCKAQQLPLS